MKRIIALLMTVALLLALCACGGEDGSQAGTAAQQSAAEAADTDNGTEPVAAETDYPTGRLDFQLPEGEWISAVSCAGGRIYALVYQSDEDGVWTGSRVVRVEPDGTVEEIAAPGGEYSMITSFLPLSDGSVWYWASPMEMEVVDSRLVHAGADGTELGHISSGELEEDAFSLLPGPEGGVVLETISGAVVLDSAAGLAGTAALERGFLSELYALEDGSIVGWNWTDLENGEGQFVRLDTEAMAFVTVEDVEYFSYDTVLGGTLERLLITSDSDIFTCNVLTGEKAAALTWADLGINDWYSGIDLLDSGTVVIAARQDMSNWQSIELYIYPVGYTINSGDKTTLTLAGVNLTDAVRELVSDFNLSSSEYYVELADYYDYDFLTGEGEQGERLLYEINTGELPDIILFNDFYGELSVENLARKGYLMDIGALIDSDPDLSRSDFLENILEAASIDGTLYTVPMEYEIHTAAVSAAIAGNATGCTLEDWQNWIAENPELDALAETTRANALQCLLLANDVIDGGDLDGDMLADILEFTGTLDEYCFPQELDGSYILVSESEFDVCSVPRVFQSRLGEDYALVGWPSADGDGNILQLVRELAIASNTDCPEGCWALLKHFITAEYQAAFAMDGGVYAIPLRIDALEAAQAQQPSLGYTEDEIAVSDGLIRSVSKVYRYNSLAGGIVSIIQEEAELYYAGQKTLESAVSSIQSRAGLYIAEQG